MRRHITLYGESKKIFYASIKTAWENGATPTELARLLNLSIARVKQIVYKEHE